MKIDTLHKSGLIPPAGIKALFQRVAWTVVFALLTLCWCGSEKGDRIVFLHLKVNDSGVVLVGSSVKPGQLKTPIAADKKAEIFLELTAADGSTLWNEVIPDPRVQHLEYEDAEQPGKLKIKKIKLKETEFIVRVPFHKDAKTFKIHRLDKPANRREAGASGTSKELLGTISISADAEDAQ